MTFEKILELALSLVPDNVRGQAIDKREGSIIYDALAPMAAVLADAYIDRETVFKMSTLRDSQGEFLDRLGSGFSELRKAAIPSQRHVIFEGTTPLVGTRFGTEGNLYWTYLGENIVECDTPGEVGNYPPDGTTLVPITQVGGLQKATLKEVIRPGSEKEQDDIYRNRIIKKLDEPRINSNRNQIKSWCEEIPGIGGVKVISLWNGVCTAKAVLIGTDKKPASPELVKRVQTYIDPPNEKGEQGLGNGKADIGLVFTADAASIFEINIDAKVALKSNVTLEYATTQISEKIEDICSQLAFSNQFGQDVIKHSFVFSELAGLSFLDDIQDLKINGGTTNISVPIYNVPVKGVIKLVSIN